MLNILAIQNKKKELDQIGYDMLGRLSVCPDFRIFVALSLEKERACLQGRCQPLDIPPICSKFDRKAICVLRRHIRQHHIDILFSPGSSALSNGLFASLGTSARNVGYRGTQAKVRRLDPTYYLGVLNPRVAHIVCETEDIRTYLTRFIHPTKLSVNLKPFDVSWVDGAVRSPKQIDGLPPDAVTCVYVGCCKGRPFKGLSVLLQAMHLLDDERVHLLFIGNYDDADADLARRGPAAERIHLLGFQESPVDYLPAQDIFVLPSLRDASPRVIREAMACGLPCVVSNIPGARDLLVDGVTGLLFPAGDAQALAATLRRLIGDGPMRRAMGQAGRERIIRDFNPEAYARRFETLFRALCVNRK